MLSDEQLIRKIRRNGNRDAADELLRRHYREIYAYVYAQTGSVDLAMDLTQDIFVAILQGIASFDERRARFRTWAYHVAANKITDYYRSRAYRRRLAESAPLPEETGSIPSAGTNSSPGSNSSAGLYPFAASDASRAAPPADDSLLELVLRRDTVRQIMEIVVQYDADWIEIFRSKYLEEQTFAQIAARMRLPENTVKTRCYAMVRKIKKEVPYYED